MEPVGGEGAHFLVGGGIASLAGAVFLVRDAGVPGERITIFEQEALPSGSLDGSGQASEGYLVRGARMFEEHYVCSFDLFGSIPSSDSPGISIADEIRAFNQRVPGWSDCRLVRDGRKAPDRDRLGLSFHDSADIARLMMVAERWIKRRVIASWFRPGFFATNFWIMWSTMFSFRPWHSLAEMRRYLRRFVHLFPGFARLSGLLRTRYNQYDSLVRPICDWLVTRGVHILTGRCIVDALIEGDGAGRRVTRLLLASGEGVDVAPQDRVYLTLGSMVAGSSFGSTERAPRPPAGEGAAWRLWRNLAERDPGFGRPDVFCGHLDETGWTSFTVTLDNPRFFDFMERFSGNRTGTGGLVTFADSGWTLSIVMPHQPHFREQAAGSFVFWGYGLTGERPGEFVKKPMAQATGDEILIELAGHLRLGQETSACFGGARVLTCQMPFVTSQLMPRRTGDRPPVRLEGARNFAVIGQFCEQPRDCVFTVEYSVRSAWQAVHEMTGRTPPPPPVARPDCDPRVLLRAARALLVQ